MWKKSDQTQEREKAQGSEDYNVFEMMGNESQSVEQQY